MFRGGKRSVSPIAFRRLRGDFFLQRPTLSGAGRGRQVDVRLFPIGVFRGEIRFLMFPVVPRNGPTLAKSVEKGVWKNTGGNSPVGGAV